MKFRQACAPLADALLWSAFTPLSCSSSCDNGSFIGTWPCICFQGAFLEKAVSLIGHDFWPDQGAASPSSEMPPYRARGVTGFHRARDRARVESMRALVPSRFVAVSY